MRRPLKTIFRKLALMLVLAASFTAQAAYKNGWESLDGVRDHCGFIFYGPLSRDQIKNPNKGECAFQIVAKYVKMDERGFRDISLPRVTHTQAYYVNSAIQRYAFDYNLYRADYYTKPYQYLKDIAAWNPQICQAQYDNGVVLDRVTSVLCNTAVGEFEFSLNSPQTPNTLSVKLVVVDTE